MIIIEDDFLSPDKMRRYAERHYALMHSNGGYHHLKQIDELDDIETEILEFGALFYDMSKAVCAELWSNPNIVVPNWHIDKDEKYYHDTGKFKFPLCTLVYYAHVDEDLEGGRIIMYEDQQLAIKPKSNRLIVFPSNVPHVVEPFTGQRLSVICCPFDYQVELQTKP